MSTVLEPVSESTSETDLTTPNDASTRLKQNFTACRLQFKWLGTSKSLSSEQKSRAAESFGADGASISAGKKLIDVKHDSWKVLTSLKSQATKYWKENSLPYPESGIRLIRQNRIEDFNSTFADIREQLEAGVQRTRRTIRRDQRCRQSSTRFAVRSTDYPSSLADAFAVEWDFPSVDPPDYLRRLTPEVYAEQARRVEQRFDEAVQLAESAFVEEFDRLVNHLAERLAADDDGRPKIFRDSAVANMSEFFGRFRELNIRSNADLDELVDRCEGLMQGVQPQALRDNDGLRRSLSTNLASVQSSLDQLIVDRPRRNIIRPNRSADTSGGQ